MHGIYFHISTFIYGVKLNETWTSGSAWRKEIIDDVLTLFKWLMWNLQTRNHFKTTSWDQIDDVTKTSFVKGYSPFKFKLHTLRKLKKWKHQIFSLRNSSIEKLQSAHANETVVLEVLKIFVQGEGMYTALCKRKVKLN